MTHMPALSNPTLISVFDLEARVDVLEAGGGGGSITGLSSTDAVKLVVSDRRMEVSTTFNGTADQHAALEVNSAGVGVTDKDGGVQSFQTTTFDCTTGGRQSIAVYAGNSASRMAGSNPLNNYAVFATCSGGQNNYAIYADAGFNQFNGGALFATSVLGVQIGAGAAAAADALQINTTLTVDSTKAVSLGNNVGTFKVPLGQIDVGASTSDGCQIHTKNTNSGAATCGIVVGVDTTVNAGQRGGFFAYRGAGGGFGGANEIGLAFCAGGDFISGSTANDCAIFNTTPSKRILFSSDGTGFTCGAALDAAGKFTATTLQVGSPSGGTGPRILQGTGTPEAVVTGSVGDIFLRTDGGASTTLYVKTSGTSTNTGWTAK